MKKALSIALAALALASAAPAMAQFQKPEDAVKYRKASFTVMAAHFSRIGAMANGKAPFDAKAAQESADIVAVMSKLPWEAFGAGTDKGAPNRAKPEIWAERAKFDEGAKKMQDEMAKLNAAAKSGSLDAIKAAFGPVGGTCKACHDDFRAEKYSN